MRLLLAVSPLVLVLACSAKPSGPDAGQTDTSVDMSADISADISMDTTVDTSADQSARACEGTPCCVFADPGLASVHCNVRTCVAPEDAGTGSPPDADASGCPACPNGTACAIVCSSPSPDAGCAPSLCCSVP